MNVTVLRRNIAHPTMWDMLFQDKPFRRIDTVIRVVKERYTSLVGDELIIIMDDEVRRVSMIVGTV